MNRLDEILLRTYQGIGISKDSQFCEKYDIKANTLSTWKKREKIPYELIEKISQNENLSLDWLLAGKGEMLLQEQKTTPHEPSLSKEERELLLNFKELPPDLQEIHFLEIKTDALKEKRKQRSNNPLEAPTKTDATA